MKKKTKVGKVKDGAITSQSITLFGVKALRIYGNEVNLERATPDLIDGLKPVVRRIVYGSGEVARSEFVKTAQVVGHVMGTYHPHGDVSISGACVTMVQSCVPLLHGKGGWGNLIDSAAAMRYTNMRLSNFGRTGLDPDYANKEVTSFVPNYDDRTVEPVSIPFPLPVILFNGGEGIGYGAACNLPSFTPESVVEVIKRLLQGEKLKAEDFAKALKPNHRWGGEFVKTKENRKAWLDMFTSSKASVQFQSPLVVDSLKKTIVVSEWPQGLDPEKFILWVRSLPETNEAAPTKGSAEFTIQMKKGYNSVQFDKWVSQIQNKTKVRASYNINVTHRTAKIEDGVVTYDVALLSLSVPQLLVAWLRARKEIEIKSLTYRVKKQQAAIDYSNLLIFAASKLDIIVPIIRKSAKPREELAKALKITIEQADQILDLTLRKLTRLDQDALHTKLKEQEKTLVQLNKWLKAPKKKMLLDVDEAMEAINKDRAHKTKQDTQKLKLKR